MQEDLKMDQPRIVHLPDLCLKKIFGHFGLRDLGKCRAVCRLFKFYADHVEIRELFMDMARECVGDHWYSTDRPVDLENRISRKAFPFLNPSQFGPFQQLRFLCIHLDQSSQFRFKRLKGLRQLQHLQARFWGVSILREPDELALPNLRVFSIRHLFFSSLLLKTPRLEVLQCDKTENIEFKYPNSIKNLECHCVKAIAIAKLKRLEVVRCKSVDGLPYKNLRTVLENLKEMHFHMEFHLYKRDEYEKVRDFLMRLLNQTATWKSGQDLKIYLNDVLLVDVSQLLPACYKFMKDISNWKFQNYQLLQDDSFFEATHVDYNQLIKCLGRMSPDFLDRFSSIQKVKVTGPVDRGQFEWFLKNAHHVRHLTLSGTWLDQVVLDNLPNVISRLTSFKVEGRFPRLISNFDFLFGFPYLDKFRMGSHLEHCNFQTCLPLVLAEQMFKRIESFNRFKFTEYGGEVVELKRCLDGKRFNLALYDDDNVVFSRQEGNWSEVERFHARSYEKHFNEYYDSDYYDHPYYD